MGVYAVEADLSKAKWTSLPQMPLRETLIKTSRGPKTGTGQSMTTVATPWPVSFNTAAFMLSLAAGPSIGSGLLDMCNPSIVSPGSVVEVTVTLAQLDIPDLAARRTRKFVDEHDLVQLRDMSVKGARAHQQ
jgi:hypothetical protein